jgi:hypothetical protein
VKSAALLSVLLMLLMSTDRPKKKMKNSVMLVSPMVSFQMNQVSDLMDTVSK